MIESRWLRWILLAVWTIAPAAGRAYEVATHYNLSLSSFSQSTLATPATLANLGLKPLSANQRFPTTDGENVSDFAAADPSCRHSSDNSLATEPVDRLIACGSMFEDFPAALPQPRPFNHFFDPAHGGRPLTIPVVLFPPPKASPDWALGVGTPSYQQNSYANARTYFQMALTTPGPQSTRDASWGATFQSLGQVIHHLQDMAQPQHVRNDAHANTFGETSNLGPLLPYFHASRFEASTANVRALVDLAKSAMQGPVTAVYPAYAAQFVRPRDFWTGAAGIADYTNRNFVSAGTNFCGSATAPTVNADFALPAPNGWIDISVAQLYTDVFGGITAVPQAVDNYCKVAGQSQNVYLQNCYITMVSSAVHDPLPGALDAPNDKASTFSVFDEDLQLYNQFVPICGMAASQNTGKVFALNSLNFAASYKFLMPHAVAYSAGMINYFFRGAMTITPPPEGVYGIIDHSDNGCDSPCGFRKLKAQVKNITPGGEAMTNGTLTAVVKFHRNTCYQPDLSGEYGGSSNFRGNSCRSPDDQEEIVVSDPVSVSTIPITDPGLLVPFSFGSNPGTGHADTPIPINASDVLLQVVFQGALGQEQGAVAVSTKDISEPNYVAVLNVTDYVFEPRDNDNDGDDDTLDADDTGDNRYHPLGYKGFNSDVIHNNIGIGFAGAAAPIASLAQLRGGQFARLAFLTDIADLPDTVFYDGSQGNNLIVQPEEFKQDDTTGNQYTRSCPVSAQRTLYWEYLYFFYQTVNDGHIISGKTLIAKDADLNAPAGRLAAAGATRPRFAAKYDHTCVAGTGGIYDFSTPEQGPMTPLAEPSSLPWSVTF